MRRRDVLAAGLGPALAPLAGAASAHRDRPLSWFCWDAAPWLAQPARQIAQLPSGSRRVLLGPTERQLHESAQSGAMLRLIRAAHAQGLAVELLLGEPSWVEPGPRRHLVSLLRGVRHLPFDGLNLDLEHAPSSGLGTAAWRTGIARTLSAARDAVRWPLALTTHGRELESPEFVQRLGRAGVTELVPMVYVSFAHLVHERAVRVLQAATAAGGDLRVTVAQSCEPHLARGESWHRYGRQGALAAWDDLAGWLGAHPRFDGLAIQSYEAFHTTG